MSKPLPSRHWQDLTTAEFTALRESGEAARIIAILPVGAMEQHGPHLPVSVDAEICAALTARVADRAPAGLPLLIIPQVPVGVSPEHGDFPGTLSFSAETMIHVMLSIGRGVAGAGLRKLVVVNTHGGQPQVLDIVAQKLRRRHRLMVFPLNAYRFWDVAAEFGTDEAAHGIHGGAAETSIMQAIAPDQVRTGEIQDFANLSKDWTDRFEHLRAFGRMGGFAWQTQDLNPLGAMGDATKASAAAGQRLLDQAAEKLIALLTEIDAVDPETVLRDKR